MFFHLFFSKTKMQNKKTIAVCIFLISCYIVGMFAIGFGWVMPEETERKASQTDVTCKLTTCNIFWNDTNGNSFGTMTYYVPVENIYHSLTNQSLLCKDCDTSCWSDYGDVKCCVYTNGDDFLFHSRCDGRPGIAVGFIIIFGIIAGALCFIGPLSLVLSIVLK